MRALYTFAILYFLCHSGNAQRLHFIKPQRLNEIPSSETYNIIQDKKGYLWFSTDAGLCKFNGSTIKIFDRKNGLPDASVYAIKEGKTGELWISTANNRLLKIKDDSITQPAFSKNYSNLLSKLEMNYVINVVHDSLWISTQKRTVKINPETESITTVNANNSSADYCFITKGNAIIPVKKMIPSANIRRIHILDSIRIQITGNGKQREFSVPYGQKSNPPWRVNATATSEHYLIAFGTEMLILDKDYNCTVQRFPSAILSLYADPDGGVWIGTMKEGVYYIPDLKNMGRIIKSLEGFSVSGVCEDYEGGIWTSTLENGIFYCRNKHVFDYTSVPGMGKKTEMLRAVDDQLFLSCRNNEIVRLVQDSIEIITVDLKEKNVITDLVKTEDGWVISGINYIIQADKKFNHPTEIKKINTNLGSGFRQVIITPEKRIFSIQFGHMVEIVNGKQIPRITPLFSAGRCLLYDENKLILGCKDGLYTCSTDDFSYRKIAGIKDEITSLLKSPWSDILVATKGNGLYSLKDNSVKLLSTELKLPTDRFMDLAKDDKGNVWAATNMGIIKIFKKENKLAAEIYNHESGLPADEILMVEYADGKIYFSTTNGVFNFDNTNLRNSHPPVLLLNNIRINNLLLPRSSNSFTFQHDENTIQLLFDVLTFKSDSVTLIATVNGITRMVKSPDLTLNNLDPGNYTIRVHAVNNDNVKSELPVIFQFEILKPLWQTSVFIIFVGIAGLSSILFITRHVIRQRVKKEREKVEVQRRLAEYHMAALRAQMNPHFLFNCINSIQHYILSDNSEKACEYLAKFSKLIRMVLNYSSENLIPLRQEIEVVKLYIELEQERFKNKFTYSINLEQKKNIQEAKVPALILQPYVENAIWHGLMNLENSEKGHISIQANIKENELLEVIIEDNGVGLTRAELLSARPHKSFANVTNNQRNQILNILSGKKGNIIIREITDSQNNVCGTRVLIEIPQGVNINVSHDPS